MGEKLLGSPGSRLQDGDYSGGCLRRSALGVNARVRKRMNVRSRKGRSWAAQQRPQSTPARSREHLSKLPAVGVRGLNLYIFLLISHWLQDASEREPDLEWASFLQLRQLLKGLTVEDYLQQHSQWKRRLNSSSSSFFFFFWSRNLGFSSQPSP